MVESAAVRLARLEQPVGVSTARGSGEVGGRQLTRWIWVVLACTSTGPFWSTRALAIPAFARLYDKPCHACHTVYPQLNAAGEELRARGLHGLTPAIEPYDLGRYFGVPGTLPVALQFAFGEDITQTNPPGPKESTLTHFNFNFLSLLFGGELGPYLTFFADYTPLFTNPQTGEVMTQTRPGLAFLQAHADPWGALGNLRLGLFELPVGESPRVHRLSVRPYLIYGITASRLLAQRPPTNNPFVITSTQIGGEASLLGPDNGLEYDAGFTYGSNNRIIEADDSTNFFTRAGYEHGPLRSGIFLYFSPNMPGDDGHDQLLRLGPDLTWTARQARLAVQFLAGHDSHPTDTNDALWYYGGFVEGEYRIVENLITLLRFDYTGMPDFNDEPQGGTVHVRRRLWEVTAGAQYLIRENFKLVAELTYSSNHEAVSDTTTTGVTATVRVATAFWPLTPPLVDEYFGPTAHR